MSNDRVAGKSSTSGGGGAIDLNGRMMPESLAAEAAVLGSMLIDPACIGEVVEQFNSEAFYRIEHQIIYEAIVSLYENNRGDGLDGVLLRAELEKRGQLENIGGVEYFGKVLESVPSTANVGYYSGIVKEKFLLRQMISAVTEVLDESYSEQGDVAAKLDSAEQKIFAITNKRIGGTTSTLKDLVSQAYENIESREGAHVTGLSTGYFMLDDLTCGLQRGEMIIVAGRPSMGKTSLALNIAEHIGIAEKMPIAIFSLEMGKHQLAERFLCSNSRVDAQHVRKGMLETSDYQELVKACSVLSDAPIFIDDTAGLTPLELRAKARRLKSHHNIELIIVDYLQLMSLGSGRSESRQQEITEISRYVKALARELDVPIIMLSQLNRAAENRENHRPRMSDLRESGSIEQDADVVMLLHREDYYRKDEPGFEPDHKAEVIIAKQRNGPTGKVDLMFMDKLARFENIATHIEEPF